MGSKSEKADKLFIIACTSASACPTVSRPVYQTGKHELFACQRDTMTVPLCLQEAVYGSCR